MPRESKVTTRFSDKRLDPVLAVIEEHPPELRVDAQVTFSFDPEEIHFFDPFSGENLWREVASRRINQTI